MRGWLIGMMLVAVPAAGSAAPKRGETIIYHAVAPPLCMGCSGYIITLGPDGRGTVLTGREPTKLFEFNATRRQARAFAARLEPYRPRTFRQALASASTCRVYTTDQDMIDITWQRPDARVDHLTVYEGCDEARHRAMIAAIASAPALLPINAFTGHR